MGHHKCCGVNALYGDTVSILFCLYPDKLEKCHDLIIFCVNCMLKYIIKPNISFCQHLSHASDIIVQLVRQDKFLMGLENGVLKIIIHKMLYIRIVSWTSVYCNSQQVRHKSEVLGKSSVKLDLFLAQIHHDPKTIVILMELIAMFVIYLLLHTVFFAMSALLLPNQCD